MKHPDNTPLLINTTAGSIFSMLVVSPSELVSTFLIGAIGAMGAFCASLILKYIAAKIKEWFTKK